VTVVYDGNSHKKFGCLTSSPRRGTYLIRITSVVPWVSTAPGRQQCYRAVVSGQLERNFVFCGVEIKHFTQGSKIHAYLFWFKAHLIGIVVWFAGLFYLVRLLSITLRRMNSQNQPARFSRISIRLWKSGFTTSLPHQDGNGSDGNWFTDY